MVLAYIQHELIALGAPTVTTRIVFAPPNLDGTGRTIRVELRLPVPASFSLNLARRAVIQKSVRNRASTHDSAMPSISCREVVGLL
mgnify:FL=1